MVTAERAAKSRSYLSRQTTSQLKASLKRTNGEDTILNLNNASMAPKAVR
jgi:hypothetical protein